MIDIAKNLEDVRNRIEKAQQKSPTKNPVTLIAVTKNHPPEFKDIGENRIQEAQEKFQHLNLDGIQKHLIGHLQTNKVNRAVELFDLIHSIDSKHLLRAVARSAEKIDKIQDILIQINLAHEESKSGIDLDSLDSLVEISQKLPSIRLRGLMFIAPNFEDVENTRPLFREMFSQFRRLRDKMNLEILSMGMTHDFEIAIEEGATHVRIGTAIFGVRNYE